MGYSNETTNLRLPQYANNDVPSWLTDFNQAMLNIDNAFGEIDGVITEKLQGVAEQLQGVFINISHPIGSFYWTVDSANPNSVFPNTQWVQVKDKFVLAVGDKYNEALVTGGADEVTLETKHMAPHVHQLYESENIASTGLFGVDRGYWGDITKPIATSSGSRDASGNQPLDPEPFSIIPPYVTAFCWRRIA